MSGSNGTCGGGGASRRRFLQTAAATGAGLALTNGGAVQAALTDAEDAIPKVKLGKTGQMVSKLGMGTSWPVSTSFVQAALLSGVGYIDTSESYENTVSEKVLGEAIEKMQARKKVYLVTKNSSFRNATGAGAAKVFEKGLAASLERLRTDYADAYYLHGLTGAQIGMLRDDGVKQAFLDLKKAGKIRFAGVSCHDAMLPEILETAAEVGWIDQIMIQYNFRVMPGGGRGRGAGGNAEEFAKAFGDKLQRAIDKAVKANLGLIAMKSQSGAASFPDRVAKWTEKGVKKEVAAIKAVWGDDRMQVVVSEMTTRSDLRENIAASREALTVKEAKLLEEHRNATSKLYCHGCGHLCETAARGVPVATVLRYYRYYEAYGKREQARALYQALPNVSRQLIDENLLAAEAACPFELPVAQLVKNAHSKLS